MTEKALGEKRFETEEDLTQAEIPDILPVLPLRGIVIFPSQIHPFLVSRASSLKLIEEVGGASRIIGLTAQKNPEEESPNPEGLFARGTAVRILKMLKYPDQSVRVLVQGLARIELGEFVQRAAHCIPRWMRRLMHSEPASAPRCSARSLRIFRCSPPTPPVRWSATTSTCSAARDHGLKWPPPRHNTSRHGLRPSRSALVAMW